MFPESIFAQGPGYAALYIFIILMAILGLLAFSLFLMRRFHVLPNFLRKTGEIRIKKKEERTFKFNPQRHADCALSVEIPAMIEMAQENTKDILKLRFVEYRKKNHRLVSNAITRFFNEIRVDYIEMLMDNDINETSSQFHFYIVYYNFAIHILTMMAKEFFAEEYDEDFSEYDLPKWNGYKENRVNEFMGEVTAFLDEMMSLKPCLDLKKRKRFDCKNAEMNNKFRKELYVIFDGIRENSISCAGEEKKLKEDLDRRVHDATYKTCRAMEEEDR